MLVCTSDVLSCLLPQVANVVRLLGPAADEGVTPSEELVAILLSFSRKFQLFQSCCDRWQMWLGCWALRRMRV